MKRKIALLIAALATVIMAISLTTPANAVPPGTLVYKTNPCILDEVHSVGYCVNDPNASLTNFELMQNWKRDAQGEPNNDWHGWRIGYVTTAGNGWPWPASLVELGSGKTYDSIYSGNWVVMINFAPFDHDTNYCLADNVAQPNGSGLVVGYTCNSGALNQWWVSRGGAYINVRGTWDTANDGDVGYITLEGEFTNGGTVGAEVGVGSIYQDYHWYRRFGT